MDCRFLRHRRRKRDASGEAGWDVQTSWPIPSAFEPPETRKKKTVPRRNANIRISGCLRKQGVIYIEKHGGTRFASALILRPRQSFIRSSAPTARSP